VGERERDAGGAFELDFSPAPVQRVDAGRAVGIVAGDGSLRTLLQGEALPLPPSDNRIHDTRIVETWKGPNGQRLPRPRKLAIKYNSDDYKAYKQEILERLLVLKAWHHSEQPIELCILVCYRDRRAADIGNRVKALQDALKDAHLFNDDSQVKCLELREGPIIKHGMAKVTVREILFDPMANLRWIDGR
jgi:Holliday junction resolvase RusA-like endonuclease